MPGRTDNEIKNYWRTHFKKKDIKSSKKQDKRRSQILKQKLQQHDCHNGHHQLQPKEEETSIKGASLTNVEAKTTTATTHQLQPPDDHQYHQRQDQMVSNSVIDQGQCYNPLMINQDVASWWDTMGDFLEYGSWGGLWNLDDPASHDHHLHHQHGRMDNGTTTAGLKLAAQNNQGVATYCGGDSNVRAIETQANKAFSFGGDYNNNLYNYQGYSF